MTYGMLNSQSIMKSKIIKEYQDKLDHMLYYNNMAPFPVYDTEDVEDLRKLIDKMNKDEYNKEPVTACKHCKSLHIVTDELDNEVCFRCGSVNDTITFENIDEYETSLTKDK